MKNTTIQDVELSITVGGTEYEFLNCTTVSRQDGLTKSLLTSPQDKTAGLVTTTGLTAGVALAYTLYEVPTDIINLLEKAFRNEERVTIKQVGKKSRESMGAQDCIITTSPRNGDKSEGSEAESVNLTLQVARNRIKDENL